jgi:hypothetical protein
MPLAIPAEELKTLSSVLKRECISVALLLMRDCGEEFTGETSAGFAEVTWGLSIAFEGRGELILSWEQDSLGNPNRISVKPMSFFQGVASCLTQVVSDLDPWRRYVGSTLDHFAILSYESNYARPPGHHTWHPVAWGVDLRFSSCRLLVAVAQHGKLLEDPMANDELAIVYDPLTIDRVIRLRDGFREEWQPQ